jgi:hypothetical protein
VKIGLRLRRVVSIGLSAPEVLWIFRVPMLFPVALLICCFCLAVKATVTDFLSAI